MKRHKIEKEKSVTSGRTGGARTGEGARTGRERGRRPGFLDTERAGRRCVLAGEGGRARWRRGGAGTCCS